MAFLYLAVATSGGALAFIAGQRMSGRTPPEVDGCNEQAILLEGIARELDAMCDDVDGASDPDDARAALQRARDELDEAISRLRRGADLVV